jgi:type II secretory ATPase GspE/PulE/Tfp pilus assembly ATPase PilB-like protein
MHGILSYMSQALMDLLIKEKVVAEAQVARLGSATDGPPELLMARCVAMGMIDDQKLMQYLAQRFALPSVNLESLSITPEVAAIFPLAVLEKMQAVPIKASDSTVVVTLADPTFIPMVTEKIKNSLRKQTEVTLTSFSHLQGYFGRAGASDIHIEPTKNSIRVRLRIDGNLIDLKELSISLKETLVARTKVLAKLDTAERRMPQDGKLKTTIAGREYDLRVNVLPMIYGESIVMRLIKQDSMNLSFSNLGFSSHQEKLFRRAINAPYGITLVTGPTGSGKTTTLYAALTELNSPTMKLATVEDPVEYNLEGVCQTQVNKEVGLGFAEVLRALLRQDPDVILVGEIRDPETAAMAVQAGLTGHIVLSTLHTNDAPSAILRLTNMGLEPILVVSAVNLVVAQRLLRKLCDHCRYSSVITSEEVRAFGLPEEKYANTPVYRAKGCKECGGAGYKGRIVVYEVMELTEDLKELVLKGDNSLALRKAAVKNGMETLPMAALNRAIAGLTSLQEAISCVVN